MDWQRLRAYRDAWRLRDSTDFTRRIWACTKPSRTGSGWDRDLAVQELTRYYEMLQRLYLPHNAILYPPEGGWPDIPEGDTKFHTARANDFMRHVPYLSQYDQELNCCGGVWTVLPQGRVEKHTRFDFDDNGNLTIDLPAATNPPTTDPWWRRLLQVFDPRRYIQQVYAWFHHRLEIFTADVDYRLQLLDSDWYLEQLDYNHQSCHDDSSYDDSEEQEWDEHPPRHIVQIVAKGDRDGHQLYLDTQSGEWLYPEVDFTWLQAERVYALDEFIPKLVKDFKAMRYIPKLDYLGAVAYVGNHPNDVDALTIELLRYFGWPGKDWNRAGFDAVFLKLSYKFEFENDEDSEEDED